MKILIKLRNYLREYLDTFELMRAEIGAICIALFLKIDIYGW